MKKLIIILLACLIYSMTYSQKLIIKQYDGKGSCLRLVEAKYDFYDSKLYLKVAVYRDYSAYREGQPYEEILPYSLRIIDDPTDSVINYLQTNNPFYATTYVRTLNQLPAPPDTTWVDVSNSYVDTTLTRKVGVYSAPNDEKKKICVVNGLVKYYKNDTLLPNYTQPIAWTIDNLDSVETSPSTKMGTYDFFMYLKANMFNNDMDQVIDYGIKLFDPGKINDRVDY